MVRQNRPEDLVTPLVDWRSAAWRVSTAWEEWRDASGFDRERAHARYVEALADEEIAAARLEHSMQPAQPR